jgi:hypothetical protein
LLRPNQVDGQLTSAGRGIFAAVARAVARAAAAAEPGAGAAALADHLHRGLECA